MLLQCCVFLEELGHLCLSSSQISFEVQVVLGSFFAIAAELLNRFEHFLALAFESLGLGFVVSGDVVLTGLVLAPASDRAPRLRLFESSCRLQGASERTGLFSFN